MNYKMKFTFSYGGGFSGLKYQLNSDSNCLDPAYKQLLEDVSRQNADELHKDNTVNKNAFSYKLEINNGSKPVILVMADNNIPVKFEPLIAYLTQMAGWVNA